MWLRSHPTSTRAAEQENAVCPALSPLAGGFSVRKASAVECVNGTACVQIECSWTACSDYRGASCPVWFLILRLPATLSRSTTDPWSNWSACQRAPRFTGSSHTVHSPLHVSFLYVLFSFLIIQWKKHLLLFAQARMSAWCCKGLLHAFENTPSRLLFM